MIAVINKQNGTRMELQGPKSVRDLLLALKLMEGTVLVTRNGELLTGDVKIHDGETLELIPVVSGG